LFCLSSNFRESKPIHTQTQNREKQRNSLRGHGYMVALYTLNLGKTITDGRSVNEWHTLDDAALRGITTVTDGRSLRSMSNLPWMTQCCAVFFVTYLGWPGVTTVTDGRSCYWWKTSDLMTYLGWPGVAWCSLCHFFFLILLHCCLCSCC
jgi:hypothetical protein